jgi:ABC-type sugar transport system ATPase subunit
MAKQLVGKTRQLKRLMKPGNPEVELVESDRAAGKVKPGKKRQAALELAAELKVLRSALKEIVEHFNLRVDSHLVEMIRILEKDQILDEPLVLPSAKVAAQLAKKIRGLKLKPNKGKLKDIFQISKLVNKLADKMPIQP